jgi:hypothetical protein
VEPGKPRRRRAQNRRGFDGTRRKPERHFPDKMEWEFLERLLGGIFILLGSGTFLLCRDKPRLHG